jgi:hypothetical protein
MILLPLLSIRDQLCQIFVLVPKTFSSQTLQPVLLKSTPLNQGKLLRVPRLGEPSVGD